jgi:hypothetical protein
MSVGLNSMGPADAGNRVLGQRHDVGGVGGATVFDHRSVKLLGFSFVTRTGPRDVLGLVLVAIVTLSVPSAFSTLTISRRECLHPDEVVV